MEEQLLREQMLSTAKEMAGEGYSGEEIWAKLWVVAGRPIGCFEDEALRIANTPEELVDYFLKYR